MNPSKAQWERILQQALGSSYMMVCGHTLQATHSIVFVHAALVPFVSDVKSHAVSTGVKIPGSSRLGNKGGIGISLTLGAHKMVFINAHLAHAKKGKYTQVITCLVLKTLPRQHVHNRDLCVWYCSKRFIEAERRIPHHHFSACSQVRSSCRKR